LYDPNVNRRPPQYALLAAAVFALAAALFTATGFLPGRVFLPLDLPRDFGAWKHDPNVRVVVSNKLLSDAILEFRPWDHEARRQLAAGAFPWRNPWAGDGAHLFANPEASLLFPLTWLRVAMGDRGWALNAFLKLFLAGLGMWWLARVATKCDWRSALVAGFVYMTCGYMTVWLLSPHTNVYAMLPWLAASAMTHRRFATFAFAALATAGGHPETLFYGVVAIAIYLWSARWLAWAFLGFALCAVQLVPFAIAASHSDLLAQRLHAASPTRLFAIPATLLPGYLGSPLAGEIDLSALGGENFNERAGGYAGLVALIVVLAAWRHVPRRALIIALAALVLSWHLPLLRVIDKLPGATARLGLVFAFFISMCLGSALDALLCHPERSEGPGGAGGAQALPRRPLATLGVTLILVGVFLALPPAQPLLTRAAREGIALLQHRGYLHLPPAVYEARLARYLAGFAAVALRRIAVPGLCLALLGLARSRALAATAIVIEMVAFAYGYNPAVRAVAPIPLPRDDRFLIAAAPEVYPPNLATLQQLRDLRSYDVLQSRERIAALKIFGYDAERRAFPSPAGLEKLGVRWFLTDRGIVELPNAIPQPLPANVPPAGFPLGLAISAAAVAIESFFATRARHDRNAPG
jgi:hypothetical protein